MYYNDSSILAAVGNKLAEDIFDRAQMDPSSGVWTTAVHHAFANLAGETGWHLLPHDGPYKGEYLCDFTLHEDGYGCRIACESQWMNWRRGHRKELAWAFDKLRGVKADLKVFVFEGDEDDWNGIIDEYMNSFAQFSEGEAYLSLHWDGKQFHKSLWIASHAGKHENIVFRPFDSAPQTMSAYVLEKYGNNAAISCPACAKVYILSKMLNQKNGRKCPHCERSRATFEGENARVEKFDPIPAVRQIEDYPMIKPSVA